VFAGVFAKKMRNLPILLQRKDLGGKLKEERRYDEVPRTWEAQLKDSENAQPCYRMHMTVPCCQRPRMVKRTFVRFDHAYFLERRCLCVDA